MPWLERLRFRVRELIAGFWTYCYLPREEGDKNVRDRKGPWIDVAFVKGHEERNAQADVCPFKQKRAINLATGVIESSVN